MDMDIIQKMQTQKSKGVLYSFLIMLLGSVLLLVMLFMPYATAAKEWRSYLLESPDYNYVEEIGMTNKDAVHISLVEYARLYKAALEQGIEKEISIICIVVITLFAVFSFLSLLMSILRKPIVTIIFDILAMITFKIIQFDFKDRGVIPSSSYTWGIANYMIYILGILIMFGSIWLFIEKRKEKKVN